MRILFFLLIITLFLAACGASDPAARSTPVSGMAPNVAPTSSLVEGSGERAPQRGDPAPDFSFELADGSSIALSDLHGRKVLLNFWATWCFPCREEMPALEESLALYGEDEFAIVAISIEEPELINQFGREFDLSFPLVSNQAGDISQYYGVSGLPTTFFIDREGLVVNRHLGALDRAEIDEILASIP
jgi:peroxiredoxin